jgi:2-polyprenyl-3-methyl-5-hydroxy-6-metoxy-1,4-benzoquinol methylase
MTKSEKFWDKIAKYYDQAELKDKQTYSTIIEKTNKYLNKSDIILDFGCGTGLVSNVIARNVKKIFAIDTSYRMIEIAQNKANTLNVKNIDYRHSTLFDKRYINNSFDVILMNYVLHLLNDPQRIMQRISELLKPDGLIISVTPCLGEKLTFKSILLLLFSKIGLVPYLKSFTFSNLMKLISNAEYTVIETDCLGNSATEYFIAARKKQPEQ